MGVLGGIQVVTLLCSDKNVALPRCETKTGVNPYSDIFVLILMRLSSPGQSADGDVSLAVGKSKSA